MNHKVLVSVIMSVFNTKEEYLRCAIESILGQTFQSYEFIIVLDLPTDNSAAVVDEYKKKDDRIVVIRNESNIGLTRSLNKALKIAKGKYIARMDADDIAVTDRLEKQYVFLEENKKVGVVGGHVYTGQKNVRYMTPWTKDSEETRIRMLFRNAGVPHPTAMFRRNYPDGSQVLYDENIVKSQDFALWSEYVKKADIVVMDAVFLVYRIHENQISAAPSGQIMYSSITVKKQLEDIFGIEDEKAANVMANIFVGQEKPQLIEIKELFKKLIVANKTRNVFKQRKLKILLKEICVEYLYMYRTGMKDFLKQLIVNPELIAPVVVIKFIQLYIMPKIKHDKLVEQFENDNKKFLAEMTL